MPREAPERPDHALGRPDRPQFGMPPRRAAITLARAVPSRAVVGGGRRGLTGQIDALHGPVLPITGSQRPGPSRQGFYVIVVVGHGCQQAHRVANQPVLAPRSRGTPRHRSRLATVSRTAESSSGSRECGASGTTRRSPGDPSQECAADVRRTRPCSTCTVASPGLACSSSVRSGTDGDHGLAQRVFMTTKTVVALRPLDATRASSNCARTSATARTSPRLPSTFDAHPWLFDAV